MQDRWRKALLLISVGGFPVLSIAQQAPSTQSAAAAGSVTAPFAGDWVGVLEYRDFQTDARVQLPTWLTVKQAATAGSLELTYTDDDGPNKIVVERSTVTIDAAGNTFTITSDRDHSSDVYKIEEFKSYPANHRGKLTLTGTGTENDKKVDVRITIAIGRNLYQFVKETRLPGQEFLFRDGYTFTRRDIPAASPAN
jgi:hypothetical protein